MDGAGSIYSDLLVRNLLYIAELNAFVWEYMTSIDRSDPKFITLEESLRSEILFNFIHALGVKVRFKDAKAFTLGLNKAPADEKEQLLLNARNMLDYVNASSQSEQLGLGLFMHLNKLFLEGVKDIWDVGRMLTDRDEIDLRYDFEKDKSPVLQQSAQDFLKELTDYYTKSQAPEMLKNAILFYELSHEALFVSGNDAVSLGILTFLSRKSNLHPYVNLPKCIYNITSQTQSKSQDPIVWLELYFNELARELKELRSRLIPFVEEVRSETSKYIDLSNRQIKGLQYIKEKGKISREMYSKLNNVSTITSYRDLTNMLQKGYIKVEGIGKATRYVII